MMMCSIITSRGVAYEKSTNYYYYHTYHHHHASSLSSSLLALLLILAVTSPINPPMNSLVNHQ